MKELEFIRIDEESNKSLHEQALKIYISNPDYFELSHGNTPSFETLMDSLKALPKNSSYEDKFFEIIYLNRKPIGIVDIIYHYPDHSSSFIGLFLIDGDLHGKGFGKYVYNKIENRLKSNEVKTIKLGVLENNERALGFWKKNGFKILEKKTKKNDKGNYWTLYLMSKEI